MLGLGLSKNGLAQIRINGVNLRSNFTFNNINYVSHTYMFNISAPQVQQLAVHPDTLSLIQEHCCNESPFGSQSLRYGQCYVALPLQTLGQRTYRCD